MSNLYILHVGIMDTNSVLCLVTLHLLEDFDIAYLVSTRLHLNIGMFPLCQIKIILYLGHISVSHRKYLAYFFKITLIVVFVSTR